MTIYFSSFKTDPNYRNDGIVNYYSSFSHDMGFSQYATAPFEIFHNEQDATSFSELISDYTKDYSGLLPPGVISLDKNIVIFECPPSFKLVEYAETYRDHISSDTQFNSSYIPVPWQTYVAIFSNDYMLVDTYMYYSRNPISQFGFSEKVFLPVLPNFYSNGHLCRPFYASMDDTTYPSNVSGVIAAAYDAVWNSGWNMDLVDTIINYAQDLRVSPYINPEINHMKEYFAQNDISTEEFFSPMSFILSREKMFSKFVSKVKDLDLHHALHLAYPIPSYSQIRENDLSQLTEEVYIDQDDYETDEDYSQALEEAVADNKNSFWINGKTFNNVLNNILFLQRSNLNVIDPFSKDYYTHISKQVIAKSQVSHVPDEEPF